MNPKDSPTVLGTKLVLFLIYQMTTAGAAIYVPIFNAVTEIPNPELF